MKTPIAVVLSVVLAAGVIAANQLGAQTPPPPASSPATPTITPTSPSIATIQSIVEITRAVPSGATAVDAFTVPAGLTLVVTDIVLTNAGTTAACGGAVNRAGVATPPTTPEPTTPPLGTAQPPTTASTTATGPGASAPPAAPTGTESGAATLAGTVTQTDSTVTGPLCVPAQSTTTLPLTTGIEFGSGQVVQLLNVPAATAPNGTTAPAPLAFHLRGLLVPLS